MKFFLLGLATGILILLLFITYSTGSRPDQPIAFNHKKHAEQGMGCDACHKHYNTEAFSGMPDIAVCLECHKEAITKSPEEEKIRQFAKKGQKSPWRRLYGEPDHVFYSHRRHVVLGKMECKTCHGNIGESEKPPAAPYVQMTMGWCMSCHAKNKVTNDCLACHQ
jgi:hypothetical protein